MGKLDKRKKTAWEFLKPTADLCQRLGDAHIELPLPRAEYKRAQKGSTRLDEHARWLRKYLAQNPGDPRCAAYQEAAQRIETWIGARELIDDGQHAAAAELLSRRVETSADDHDARIMLAISRIGIQQHREALEELDRLPDSHRASKRATLLRARALIGRGARDEGCQLLWKLNEQFPKDQQVIDELCTLGEVVPTQLTPGDPNIKMAPRKDYEQMVVNRATQLKKEKRGRELTTLAETMRRTGFPKLAHLAARYAQDLDSDNSAARVILAQAALESGELDEAAGHVEALEQSGDNTSEATLYRGVLLRLQGNLEQAAKHFEDAIKREGESIDLVEQWLLSLPEEERVARAEAYHQQDPDSAVANKVLGDLLFAQSDLERAVECHRKAYVTGRTDDALTMLLHDLGRLGRLEEAANTVEADTELAQRSFTSQWNAAQLLLESGRVRACQTILKRAAGDNRFSPRERYIANQLLINSLRR